MSESYTSLPQEISNINTGLLQIEPVLQTATPTTGTTVAMSAGNNILLIEGSATLAALAVEPPSAPVTLTEIEVVFQVAVTALTWTAPSGYTISAAAPTAATAGQKVKLRLIGTVWY